MLNPKHVKPNTKWYNPFPEAVRISFTPLKTTCEDPKTPHEMIKQIPCDNAHFLRALKNKLRGAQIQQQMIKTVPCDGVSLSCGPCLGNAAFGAFVIPRSRTFGGSRWKSPRYHNTHVQVCRVCTDSSTSQQTKWNSQETKWTSIGNKRYKT